MTPFNRKLLLFILLYICVEGVVINVTFPSKIGYLAKDALVALSVALLAVENRGRTFGSLGRLTVPLLVFALIQVFYLMMPSELPWMARLVGLKMRLLYIPLMFLAYRYINTEDDWYRLIRVMAIAAIPAALFGLVLFFAGPSALRALGGSYSAIIFSPEGVWRVPGPFTSPGQFGLFLTFNSVLLIGLLLMRDLTTQTTLLLWFSLALMLLATLVSGSRTPLLLTGACAGVVVLALGRIGRAVAFAVAAYIIFAVGFATLGSGVEERIGSVASMEHVQRFGRTYFGQLFIAKMMEAPMGIGLGVATIGARHFTEFGQVMLVESYLGLIAIETGIFGLLSVLWLSAAVLSLIVAPRDVMRGVRSAPCWYAAASLVAVILLISPVNTSLDASPGNVYFWLAVGAVARLLDLERERRVGILATSELPHGWAPAVESHTAAAAEAR